MKYYLLAEAIEKDAVIKAIDFIQKEENKNDKIMFSLRTQGGDTGYCFLLLKVLNDNHKRITLACVDHVISAGFYIFYNFKGKKMMTTNAHGMYHYSWMPIDFSSNCKPSFANEGKCKLDILKSHKIQETKIAEAIMNKKELRQFKENKDVYFNYDRMLEIFPKAEIF